MQRGHGRGRRPTQSPPFNHGVLRPAQTLPLNEHETVRITIEPQFSCGDWGHPRLIRSRA